jgi:hypothetical protein
MSDNRPIVYFDPQVNRWAYRASSVGRPLRCLVTARQGYEALEPPRYLSQAAEAGNKAEIIVKAILRNQGYRISGEQGEINLLVGDTAVIRGHMDAEHIVDENGVDRVLEVKSMSKGVWDEWWKDGFNGFPEYAAQLTVYMGAISERRGKEVEALYALYNRSNPGQVETVVVRTPPANLEAIRAKVIEAEEWGDKGLPQCTGAKYFCGYSYLCDRDEMRFEELESGTQTILVELTNEYGDLLEADEDVSVRKEELREKIKTAMGTRGKADVPGWSISVTTPKAKKSLSIEKLRQRLGDELDQFWTEGETKPTLYIRRKST